jgi:hypothetical protein
MNINFKQNGQLKLNDFYIEVSYEGGDGDYSTHEVYRVKDQEGQLLNASNFKDHLDIVEKELTVYKQLMVALSIENYNEVVRKYDEEVADAWDNAPNDPTNDYQDKMYIDRIKLVYVDSQGKIFEMTV